MFHGSGKHFQLITALRKNRRKENVGLQFTCRADYGIANEVLGEKIKKSGAKVKRVGDLRYWKRLLLLHLLFLIFPIY